MRAIILRRNAGSLSNTASSAAWAVAPRDRAQAPAGTQPARPPASKDRFRSLAEPALRGDIVQARSATAKPHRIRFQSPLLSVMAALDPAITGDPRLEPGDDDRWVLEPKHPPR